MTLLQITTSPVDTTAIGAGSDTVTILDLLMKGGFMMIPIIILSIVAIYIFTERVLTIKKASKIPDQFMDNIKNRVLEGDVNGAKMMCAQTSSPIARMIEKGIARIGSPLKNIETSIEKRRKN